MTLSTADVEYILAQFDAGVHPNQILVGLQYRSFLPGVNRATIENCLRENGRRPDNQQTYNAVQGNQSSGVGRASNPSPTLDWDAQADAFAISAYRSGKSVDEILSMLRSHGYDVTDGEVALSLLRQGVAVASRTGGTWEQVMVFFFWWSDP